MAEVLATVWPSASSLSYLSIFQKTTLEPCSPRRTFPPCSVACLYVNQYGEPYPRLASRNTLIPRYSRRLARFLGACVAHGRCHGATPDSNCLMICSVTI